MSTDEYVASVNQQLERLLVYETVFKEYVHTCRNIEKGNCYASESLARLRDYYSKNVLRFNRFVAQCEKLQAPRGYAAFNQALISGLEDIRAGILMTLSAIYDNGVEHPRFEQGVEEQQQARAEINEAFARIEPQAVL